MAGFTPYTTAAYPYVNKRERSMVKTEADGALTAYTHHRKGAIGYAQARWEDSQSFYHSAKLAYELDPTTSLDYIPMGEQWTCKWEDNGRLYDHKRGCLTWVGEEKDKPKTKVDMQHTKLFVCRGCVAPTVYTVVMRSQVAWRLGEQWVKWADDGRWWIDLDEATRWTKEAIKEWKVSIPQSYHGLVSSLLDIEVYDEIMAKRMTKKDFKEWVDQQVWDAANANLEEDMAELELRTPEDGELVEAEEAQEEEEPVKWWH